MNITEAATWQDALHMADYVHLYEKRNLGRSIGKGLASCDIERGTLEPVAVEEWVAQTVNRSGDYLLQFTSLTEDKTRQTSKVFVIYVKKMETGLTSAPQPSPVVSSLSEMMMLSAQLQKLHTAQDPEVARRLAQLEMENEQLKSRTNGEKTFGVLIGESVKENMPGIVQILMDAMAKRTGPALPLPVEVPDGE
jgi:hypothetical protein